MADPEQTPAEQTPAPVTAANPAGPETAPAPAEPVHPSAEAAAAAPEAVAQPEKPKSAHDEPTLLETVKVPGAEEPAKPGEAEKDAKAAEEKPADGAAKPAETKPTEVKAEEKPAPAEEKPADAEKPADQAKPEPLAAIEYKYELPETIKLDDATRTEFHGALDTYRANPADPTPLINLYNKGMTEYAAQVERDQHAAWSETRKNWRTEIMADPELGGAGHQTAATTVARMRDLLASQAQPGSDDYKADMAALDGFLRVTGAGDHPVFWRLLHNASRYFDEPQGGDIPTHINPAPQPNGRRGRDALYDHSNSPRSKPNGAQ